MAKTTQDEKHPRPHVTVDIVPLVIHDERLCVLLAARDKEPYAGRLALLGGYVHVQEDATAGAAARRVLRDKAGITQLYVEQLSTFSGPDRDPRGWSLSIAYFSLSPYDRVAGAVERGAVQLVAVEDAGDLPFDHDAIVAAAVERMRGKGAYSDLPARLLGDDFTMRELQHAYQIAMGETVNEDGFRKKILQHGFIEPTGGKRHDPGAKKPGQLYRLKPGYAVFDRRI